MHEPTKQQNLSRRDVLGVAALGAASAVLPAGAAPLRSNDNQSTLRGNISQSVAYWCFGEVGWTVADTVRAAVSLGC